MHAIASADELIATARDRTGLSAGLDASFLEALSQLVRSINREATLTAEGAPAANERLLRVMMNRLRFAADLERAPQILSEPLLAPLIISGLPRVGSTKLHRQLAEGGDFQSLLFWQGFNPAPLPGQMPVGEDPRIAAAVEFLAWRSRSNPATEAAHHMSALEPEEDTYLLEYTLHTYWPTTYYNVPSFLHWLRPRDRSNAFGYVRQLLQYLQWQFHRDNVRPWLLKSPINFGFEREQARHLPGARFVVLHRDPLEVIPSTVAIVREVRRLYCGAPGDLRLVGDWAVEEYAFAVARHLEWRAAGPDNAVLDIPYRDVVADEERVIARVYEHRGLELTPSALERMRRWSAANAQHQHGQHVYSLEESGLTRERLDRAFAGYLRDFGSYFDR
jgi:hypothetical protein